MTEKVIKEKENKNSKPKLGKRILCILLVAIFGSLLCGFLYQTIASMQDMKRYPPPGELVDVGGYRLHLYCEGSDSPTVILEGGLAENWKTWELVQDKIASFTRVCSNDRAGLGWSDAVPVSQSSEEVAQALNTLLHNAKVPGPYVLVGHSAGGQHARSFAVQYPDEVAGLVLIDSYNENQFGRLPAELVQLMLDTYSGTADTLAITRMLAPFGIVRLLGVGEMFAQENPIIGFLSTEDREMLIATYNRTKISQAVRNEYMTQLFFEDQNQAQVLESLGDIPLTILTKEGDDPESMRGIVSPEIVIEGNQTALELKQELADLSTKGTLVVVKDTGHYIHIDQPDAVFEAIREMVISLQ